MTIPWYNYEAIMKLNLIQKTIFRFSLNPDIQHIDQESKVYKGDTSEIDHKFDVGNINKLNDSSTTTKRRKGARANKRYNLYKEDSILGTINTAEINKLVVPINMLKGNKLLRENNLYKKRRLDESYRTEEKQLPFIHEHINDMDKTNVPKQHIGSSRYVKIPYSTFAKIHHLLPPFILKGEVDTDSPEGQIEAGTKQEVVSNNINHENEHKKDFSVKPRTIKIPFVTFLKIFTHQQQLIESDSSGPKVPEQLSQLESETEQGILSPFENILQENEPVEKNVAGELNNSLEQVETKVEENLKSEINETHKLTEPNMQLGVKQRTLKIPYTTFLKIFNYQHRFIKSRISAPEEAEHPLQLDVLEENLVSDMNDDSNYLKETINLLEVKQRTIKIPRSTFLKIFSCQHRPNAVNSTEINDLDMEVKIEQEAVSPIEYPLQMDDRVIEQSIISELNDESIHLKKTNKQIGIKQRTIKIPYTTFLKIYYFQHRLNWSSTIDTNDQELNQLVAETVQEIVFKSENSLKMEDMKEKIISEINSETKHHHQLLGIQSRTIKIPYTTFLKIYDFQNRLNWSSTVDINELEFVQMEAVQETVPTFKVKDTIEVNYVNETNEETNHLMEPSNQLETKWRTIKIPYTSFIKLNNIQHRPDCNSPVDINDQELDQLEAETVPTFKVEDTIEENFVNETIEDTNHLMEPSNQLETKRRTVKIPYTTFIKIYSFQHRPNWSGTVDVNDQELDQLEAETAQETVSTFKVEDTIEEKCVNETNEDTNHLMEPSNQLETKRRTVKIPYTTFIKIYSFQHRLNWSETVDVTDQEPEQFKAGTVQEIVPMSAIEENFVNETNLDINQLMEPSNQLQTRRRTIKIPYISFLKLNNFQHRPDWNSTVDITDQELDQLVAETVPTFKVEDTIEEDFANEMCEETNFQEEPNKQLGIKSRTIKIPYTTFKKIYNFQHRPNWGETVDVNDQELDQLEAGRVQEIIPRSAIEESFFNEMNEDTNHLMEPSKQLETRRRTIKIPYTSFLKLNNFQHRPDWNSPVDINDQELDQLEEETVQEIVPRYEVEDTIEENFVNETIEDTNHLMELSNQSETKWRTIKIPYATFIKIYNFQQRPSWSETVDVNDQELDQLEAGRLQEIIPRPALEESFVNETNEDTEHLMEPSNQLETRRRTIKIPYTSFLKLKNFQHRPDWNSTVDINDQELDQLEIETVQETVPTFKVEDTIENNFFNETNDETNHPIEPNKQLGIKTRTIKIPYTTFIKIYNFQHRPDWSSTVDINDQELVQLEAATVQETVPTFRVEDAIEENFVIETNEDTNHLMEPSNQSEAKRRTIKIPYTTFIKIYNFQHRPNWSETVDINDQELDQLEAETAQETVSTFKVEDTIEEKFVNETNEDINHLMEPSNQLETKRRTIKIPYTTFLKIYNFQHRPNWSSTVDINDQELNQLEEETVSTFKVEDTIEENFVNETNKNTNYLMESSNQLETKRRTIKIPYTTFIKIYSFQHRPNWSETVDVNDQELDRLEAGTVQKTVLTFKVEDTIEEKCVNETNEDTNHLMEPSNQLETKRRTIKIPYATFIKIYNFQHRPDWNSAVDINDQELEQLEAATVQETVATSEVKVAKEEKFVNETNEDTNHLMEPSNQLETKRRTIKIPYTTFIKIYNFQHRTNWSSTVDINDQELNQLEEETVSTFKVEDTIEENFVNEKNEDTNHLMEPSNQFETKQRTIKIPFTTFEKIYSFQHRPNWSETVDINDQELDRLEAGTVQEIVRSEVKDTIEEKFVYETNEDTNYPIEPKKKLETKRRKIKIPYFTFRKIYNFQHRSDWTNTIDVNEQEFDQLEDATIQEVVPKSEHTVQVEETINENYYNERKSESNQLKETNNPLGTKSRKIKIPYSTFLKIFKFPHLLKNDQELEHLEDATVQEIVFRSEHTSKVEETVEESFDNETNRLNEPKIRLGLKPRTIKIPNTTFVKIYNLQHRNIDSRTSLTDEPEHSSLLKAEKEQEVVSSEQLFQVKEAEDGNIVNEINQKPNYTTELNKQSGVRSRSIKIPFSTFSDIDTFLNPPIFGSTFQNTFKYIDPYNKQIPQLNTKLFNTITSYHEEPYCYLVGFKSHEILDTIEINYKYNKKLKEGRGNNRSVLTPIHDAVSVKTREANFIPSVSIKVPVVVGEYNVEISLEEDVLFEEKIYKVLEISKKVILTNCKFVPAGFSFSKMGETREALRGKLFIEGYINQNIEYISGHNQVEKSVTNELEAIFHLLRQNIVLELIVQLLQVQKVSMDTVHQPSLNMYTVKPRDQQEKINFEGLQPFHTKKEASLDKPIINLLKNLAPGTNITQLTVKGKIIKVASFIEYNSYTNISTFLLENNNILSVNTNQIDSLTLS